MPRYTPLEDVDNHMVDGPEFEDEAYQPDEDARFEQNRADDIEKEIADNLVNTLAGLARLQ